MISDSTCTTCGSPLPAKVLAGLCPACVKRVALAEPSLHDETALLPHRAATPPVVAWEPPSVEEMTALLPAGAYTVESFIGRGGMGAVYKGTQLSLKRAVAIKLMRQDQSTEFRERFLREAHTLARLNHPCIVNVIDCGEAGPDLLYIVMEFVDGADLMEVIRSGGLTQERTLQILPQICEALQFAHDHGIVHRDIKPSNILLTRAGRVKVADFGLSKTLDPDSSLQTRTGAGMGTPDYAAPEQFTPGAEVDHRADIYALGVMIYQMITGQLPRGAWKPPSEEVDVDARWDQIVSRALQRDPRERYDSASQVTKALESIRPVTQSAAWVKRRRMLALSGVVVVSLMGLSTALLWKKSGEMKPQQSNEVGVMRSTVGSLPPPTVTIGTEWTHLIPHIRPERDAIRGGWAVDKNGLTAKRLPWAACKIPVQDPDGDYDLRYRVTRGEGSHLAMFFVFRKGGTGGSVLLDYINAALPEFADGLRRAQLEQVVDPDPRDSAAINVKRKEWLPKGREVTVLLQVREKELIVSVDDVEAFRWKADWSRLQQRAGPDGEMFNNVNGEPIFGVGVFDCEAVFHSIEMRRVREVTTPASASTPAAATKGVPFENLLGMRFVPVPITGGPTDGKRVLFSVWETRVRDYEAFVKETRREWWGRDGAIEQGPTHPAVWMSWEEAQAFCAWLTERERKAGKIGGSEHYRLPTDHEWSCAVGIGSQEDAGKTPVEKHQRMPDTYPWGRMWPPPAQFGNYGSEELRSLQAAGKHEFLKASMDGFQLSGYRDGFAETSPVGSFPMNDQGLYDLSGNVWELCEDWLNAAKGYRVMRGGSWVIHETNRLISSYRENPPAIRGWAFGFRCVLDAQD